MAKEAKPYLAAVAEGGTWVKWLIGGHATRPMGSVLRLADREAQSAIEAQKARPASRAEIALATQA